MPATQPDLRCYYHPDREATGQCDRCGDYLCAQCVREWEGQQVCEECFAWLTRGELPPGGRRASGSNLVGVCLFFFGLLGADPQWPGRNTALLLVFTLVAASVFALAAVQALRARASSVKGARRIIDSILMMSLAGWLGCMFMLFFWMLISGPEWIGEAIGVQGFYLMILGVTCMCALLMVGSIVAWVMAVRAGVRPIWAIVLSLVSPVLGLGTVGMLLSLSMLTIVMPA